MHDGLGMEGGKSANWRRVKANQRRMTKKQTLIRAKYQLWYHEGLSQIDIQINFARMFCKSIMKMFELCALVWFQWLCQL